MVSLTVGCSTSMGWNLRSNAASFSKCLRYSSMVVAPMVWSSPLASIGFIMLATSSPPSALPALRIVWISSMKRMILPFSCTALKAFFSLSSKSPRYLVPATILVTSSEKMILSRSTSGTLPSTIACARPSTMADLPTPGSPIRIGLFFVRRQRI